jgi:hypothetical protein
MFGGGDFPGMLHLIGPQDFRKFILQRGVFNLLSVHSDAKLVSLKYNILTGVANV